MGDLESDGLLDTATKVWCGVFKNVDTKEVKKFFPFSKDDSVYINNLLDFISSTDVLIIHNGIGFDWPLLKQLYGYEYKGKKVDTLLMSRLQRPNRTAPETCPKKNQPHSVEAYGYRFGMLKQEHEDWSQFSEEMLARCERDVDIQEKIYHYLLQEAKGQHWRDAHIMTFRLFERLHMSEQYGWMVDQEHMKRSLYFLERWIGLIDRAIQPYLPVIVEPLETKKDGEYGWIKKPFLRDGSYSASVIRYFDPDLSGNSYMGCVWGPFSRVSFRNTNLNSNLEVKNFLLSQGWEPKDWNYNKDGQKSSPILSHEEPFEGINKGIGRLVAKRVQCRHRYSTIAGWFNVIREDGRIPSVITGITTTARAKHKNIVNVPQQKSFFGKWMRKCFTSQEGMVLTGCDSDANQMRMLAARMGDYAWTEYLLNGDKKKGTDLHSVHARMAELPSREHAKTFFYGVLFGAGDAKTGKIVKGTAEDGKRLKKNLYDKLPALANLIDTLTKEWRSHAKQRWNSRFNRMEYYDGWVVGLDGRPIYIPNEHQVLVYIIQSDEAIMMSYAYLKFHDLMEERGYKWGEDYGTVCWYHDEFTVEHKPELSKIVQELSEYSIKWAGEWLKISCPHKGNAKTGKDWWDIH